MALSSIEIEFVVKAKEWCVESKRKHEAMFKDAQLGPLAKMISQIGKKVGMPEDIFIREIEMVETLISIIERENRIHNG